MAEPTLHPVAKSASVSLEDAVLAAVDGDLVRGLVAAGAADVIVEEHERRRRLHREEMVRYRRRKKSALEGMKVEEKQLSRQLQGVLRLRASAAATSSAITGGESGADKLVHALVVKEQLHHENTVLRRQLDAARRFEEVAESVCAKSSGGAQSDESEQHAELPRGGNDGGGDGRWVTFLEDEPVFYYVPFAEHECRSLASANRRRVVALQAKAFDKTAAAAVGSDSPASARAGGSNTPLADPVIVRFFQWRAHLVLEWNTAQRLKMIRYKFCKTFRLPMRSLEQVAGRMWEILHSPALFQSIYRVPVHLLILQRWRDDLSVALWSTPDPNRSVRGRTTTIFSRAAYTNPQGEECVIVTLVGAPFKEPPAGSPGSGRGVTSSVTRDGEPVEFANQGDIYFLATRLADGAIAIEHGGCVEVLSEVMAQFLMVELGGSLVRLESLVLPMRVVCE